MTVAERYETDSHFRFLVDSLEALIQDAKFTPTEIREAALMAMVRYESRRIRPFIIPLRALDTV
jgi:hypothetical protein